MDTTQNIIVAQNHAAELSAFGRTQTEPLIVKHYQERADNVYAYARALQAHAWVDLQAVFQAEADRTWSARY